jgi:toxin YoeB
MKLELDPRALEDLCCRTAQDRRKTLRIIRLIEQSSRESFAGPGKPEPLGHSLARCWTRRIDREHRLVHRVERDTLVIVDCRYHH